MSNKVCVIDYGVGNIQSLKNAVHKSTEKDIDVVTEPDQIFQHDKVILPGVGAYRDAMAILKNKGLDQALRTYADMKRPILGICLGMQLLGTKSYEHGEFSGLNLIPGEIIPFTNAKLDLIHMGWNDIHIVQDNPIVKDISSGSDFYFVHGYHFQLQNSQHTVATCDYGGDFPAIINHGNIWGAQFHPEKSQRAGLKLIQNFIEMTHA